MAEAVDAALMDGFHAMAQPLTILQSRIECQMLSRAQPEASPELFEALASEVERLCSLLRPLQQIVTARARCEPRRPTDAWRLLAPILEDFARLFANAAVALEIVPGARPLPFVYAAPDQLREIVTAMLSAAAAAATAGDQVSLRFGTSDRGVTIEVANRSPHPRPISALLQLGLALAGVRALGQGGELVLLHAPFHVRLLLSAGTAPQGSRTQPS